MQSTDSRLSYLEGFRGLCAIVVLVWHFFFGFFPNFISLSGKTPLFVFYNGHLAVCCFFVLSGYVLSYSFFQSGNESILKTGAIKRYFRLSIPVSISVLFAYSLVKANLIYSLSAAYITGSTWYANFYSFSPSLLSALRGGFINVFYGDDNFFNVYWTMEYELLGSFFIFGFLALFGKHKIRFPLYILLGLIFYNNYYFLFLAGLVLADISTKTNLDKLYSLPIAFLLLQLVVLLGSFNSLPYNSISSICLLLLILISKPLKFFFSSLEYLGKISFPVYLIHVPIEFSLSAYIFLLFYPSYGYLISFSISFLLSFVAILLSAGLINRYIDSPLTNFLSSTSKKLISS